MKEFPHIHSWYGCQFSLMSKDFLGTILLVVRLQEDSLYAISLL